ncbi:MAG: O-antigen ligase family protein [Actinomycetota bacterium]
MSRRPILDEPGPVAPILDEPGHIAPILDETEAKSRSDDDALEPDDGAYAEPGGGAGEPEPEPHPLAEFAARAARALMAAAVFAVPVIVDPRSVDAFNLAKATALWMLVLAAAATWCVSSYLGRGRLVFPRAWIVRASVALLGIATLATLLSPNRTLSLIGLYHRYEGLVSLALYVGALLLIVMLYRGQAGKLRGLVAAAGGAAGVVAAYVIVQQLGIDPVEWRGTTGTAPTYPIGNLGNPAFTASFLGISAPFVAYLAISARTRASRISWSAVGGGVLISLWLTHGRAGMVAVLAGVGALALFASRVRVWRKMTLVAAGLLVLVALPLMSAGFVDPPAPEAQPAVAEFRTDTWVAAVRMLGDRPFLGWGPESFYGQYPRYRTAVEAREQGLAIPDKPHNVFLGWATSTGTLGLAAHLVLVGIALGMVGARRRSESNVRLTAAFGAGLVAYLAQGMYSVDIPPLAFMGWFALAGIAVLTESPEASATIGGGRSWLQSTPIPTVAVVVAAVALIAAGFGPLRADRAAWEGERRSGLGWSSGTWRFYESAMRLHPREPAYQGLAASYLERVAAGGASAPGPEDDGTAAPGPEDALRMAAGLYEKASSMQPRNMHFLIGAARAYSRLGETFDERGFSSADRWLRRAVSRDPRDTQVYDLRADLLRSWADAAGDPEERELLALARAMDESADRLRAGRAPQ